MAAIGQYQAWLTETKKKNEAAALAKEKGLKLETPAVSDADSNTKIYQNTVTYLDQLKKNAEAVKKADYLAAEQIRSDVERQADVNRERAIADARSSYAVQTGAYGANAENIARGGLSGSGYADYLNSQAYATQRGEIQGARAISDAAKAQAASDEVKSKAEADATYAKNLDTYEAGKVEAENLYTKNLQTNYDKVLEVAETGEKTPNEIINMAQRYGLSDADIDILAKQANDKYIANIRDSVSLEPEAYSDQYFTELANIIGTDEATSIKNRRDNAINQKLGITLQSGDYASAEAYVDALYANGDGVIGEEQYNKLARRLFDAWHSALNTAGQTDEADALEERFMTKSGFKEYYNQFTVRLPYSPSLVIQNDKEKTRSIGGVTYSMDESSKERDEEINKSRHRRSDSPRNGEVAKYMGNYYFYDGSWRKVVKGQDELAKIFG